MSEHQRWERVWSRVAGTPQQSILSRMAVPGGWLYRLEGNGFDSLTFVPNPPPAVTLTGNTLPRSVAASINIDGQAVGRTMLAPPSPIGDGVIRCSTGSDVPGGGAS